MARLKIGSWWWLGATEIWYRRTVEILTVPFFRLNWSKSILNPILVAPSHKSFDFWIRFQKVYHSEITLSPPQKQVAYEKGNKTISAKTDCKTCLLGKSTETSHCTNNKRKTKNWKAEIACNAHSMGEGGTLHGECKQWLHIADNHPFPVSKNTHLQLFQL